MKDKELFNLIEKHLLTDEKPSEKLREIIENKINENDVLYILKKLKNIEQEAQHHPEGDVLEHTLQVVDEASKFKDKVNDCRCFMWAALLHDIGKEQTTLKRKGRWTAYNHDRVGAEMCSRLLEKISNDKNFNKSVCNLIKHHMSYLYITKNLPFGDIDELVKTSDINDVAILTLCDRLGRGDISQVNKMKIVNSINDFLRIISEKTGKQYEQIDLSII